MINLIEYIRKEFKNQDLLDMIKIGWTSQQPDLVKGVPAHVRGKMKLFLKSFLTQTTP